MLIACELIQAQQISAKITHAVRNRLPQMDARKAANFVVACVDEQHSPRPEVLKKAWLWAFEDCKALGINIGRKLPE